MRSVKCDLNFIYKNETLIKRVAAYCRVSTKHEEQISNFHEAIISNNDFEKVQEEKKRRRFVK